MAATGRVLVTGATGLLGREVLGMLIRARVPVRALARRTGERDPLAAGNIETAIGDYGDAASLEAATRDIDVIIACAGKGLRRGPGTQMSVDGEGTARLVEAAQRNGVRRLVFVSWLGVDRELGGAPYDAKRFAEGRILASGLPTVILRASTFHPYVLRLAKEAFRRKKIRVFGDGRALTSPVYVPDVAKACVLAAQEDGPGRVLEIGGPEAMSHRELAKRVARIVGRPEATIESVPLSLVRLARRAGTRLGFAQAESLDLAEIQARHDFVADNRALLAAYPSIILRSVADIVREEFLWRLPAI